MAIDPFFGSVLAAGANVLGSFIGASSADRANERAAEMAGQNLEWQRQAQQRGITWKARDIMNAYTETGIHPLALLGVQGPTFTPVTTSFAPSGVGEGIARAGQDISRGMHASADRELRREALGLQMLTMQHAAERGGLENELLRTRIASENARLRMSSAPAVPASGDRSVMPGQGDVTSPQPWYSQWHEERRTLPDITHLRTPEGGLYPAPAKDTKESIEDNFWQQTAHFWRNNVVPWLEKSARGPLGLRAPEGYSWVYHATDGWKLEKQRRDAREMLNRFRRGW